MIGLKFNDLSGFINSERDVAGVPTNSFKIYQIGLKVGYSQSSNIGNRPCSSNLACLRPSPDHGWLFDINLVLIVTINDDRSKI